VNPAQRLVVASFAAGELPLWNPDSACGMPVTGQGDLGALYPPTLLFVLGDPLALYPWYLLLHAALAALGAWALLRSLGRSRAAALLGAVAFGLAGVLTSNHSNPRLFVGLAWMPWILAALHGALAAAARGGGGPRAIRCAAAGGLALALQLLGGGFETSVMAALGCALVVLAEARRGSRALGRAASLLVLLGAVGALGAAAQLAPLAEWIRDTDRAVAPDPSERFVWSLHPLRLVEVAAPGIYGDVLPLPGYRAQRLLGPRAAVPWSITLYAGAVTAWLALVSLAGPGAARLRAWVALFGATSLLLAMGPHTSVGEALWTHAPALRSLRFPEKMLAGFALALPALAAFGADALRTGSPGLRRAAAVAAFALAVAIAAASSPGALLDGDLVSPRAAVATLPGVLSLAAAGLLALSGLRGRALVTALAALLALDLGREARAHLYSAPPASLTPSGWAAQRMLAAEPRAAKGAPPDRFVRAPSGILFTPPPGGPRDDAYPNVYSLETLASGAGWGVVPSIEGFAPAYTRRFARVRGAAATSPGILAMLNVRFRLEWTGGAPAAATSERPGAVRADGTRLIARNDGLALELRELPLRLPRAFLTGKALALADEAEVARRIADPAFAPWEMALLEDPDAAGGRLLADGPPQGRLPRIVSYAATEVVIEAEVEGPPGSRVALVLGDAWDRWWTATVDGAPARVFPANTLLRAVLLSPGRHEVRFTYRPWPVYAGLAVSAATFVVTGAALLLTRRRRRARGGGDAPSRDPVP